jgi:hypothetical protein
MSSIHYKIVQHDGGWAYKLGDVFSEPFPTHDAALRAAQRVVHELHIPGETVTIEFQDADGAWHTELARGLDHPDADITE